MRKRTAFSTVVLLLVVATFGFCGCAGMRTGKSVPDKITENVVTKVLVSAEIKPKVTALPVAPSPAHRASLPDYENIPKDVRQTLCNFDEAIKIIMTSYYRKWTKEDQERLDKYLRRYFPQKADCVAGVSTAKKVFVTERKRMEYISRKYFPGLEIEELVVKNHAAHRAAIDFLEAIDPEYKELSRFVSAAPSPDRENVQEDTRQTFRDFVAAIKIYHRQWTEEDHEKLDEYLMRYFPRNLDRATNILTKEEYTDWLSSLYFGVGILIGIDEETFAVREKRMGVISRKYFPGLEIEELVVKNHAAHRAAIDFLEAIDPEYKELRRLVTNGIIGEKGTYLKDVPLTKIPSPAQKAGLTRVYKGWFVTEVDGETTVGQSLPDVIEMIRGRKGTTVRLALRSPDGRFAKTFKIVRGPVRETQFEYKMIPGTKIGYLKFTAFAEVKPRIYIEKITELYRQGAKGFIIDLENNPGGRMSAVLGLAGAFLESGKDLLYVTTRNGGVRRYLGQTTAPKLFSGPVVIIQNDCSASASEVLALILKEYGIATLVGTKSYGKGSVQSADPLSGGGAIKYTNSLYYSPVKKICIDQKGIEPDVVIKDDPGTKTNEPLEKAIEILIDKLKR